MKNRIKKNRHHIVYLQQYPYLLIFDYMCSFEGVKKCCCSIHLPHRVLSEKPNSIGVGEIPQSSLIIIGITKVFQGRRRNKSLTLATLLEWHHRCGCTSTTNSRKLPNTQSTIQTHPNPHI